jgi:hypothetical protein
MKADFLANDLSDALRWLFEGAVAWEAARRRPESAARHQAAVSMYASIVQARALYEFYFSPAKKNDDARARDFASTWNPAKTELYRRYMAEGQPANKRVFHLVYNRPAHAGASGEDGPEHLKNRVLEVAKELRRLTEEFAHNADPAFRDSAKFALQKALKEAVSAADYYGIANPF